MDEILQLAALGRHVQIGMLYDSRSDTLIPDVTLWNSQTILENTVSQNQPSTETEIITLDSMEKKANALNVSESLKASLLGGLVELKGSSKYFNDTKVSKQQARVTLQYKTTNKLEQLMMTHLGRQDVIYPSVFEEGTATHVITSVLYGAQAFFVFDRMVSSGENLQEIQLNMEVTIEHFQRTHGEPSLRMTEEQKCNANKLSCTFYGDFPLQNNPTSFQDFINIYTTLPILLGKAAEHSVPMTIWLYPLKKLDPKAAQLVKLLSVGLGQNPAVSKYVP
ncbi:neoverrucotoxin subunit beta-like [Hypanus sabinus]|uniref:neoverrucotoxin subunit beta-like n=1 Tax=Hypanus sabinus TaxID=79690 RepID=UPI0028C4884A|nr:neoverrucotoxin subunit beta-like [Hypanus sabinus]